MAPRKNKSKDSKRDRGQIRKVAIVYRPDKPEAFEQAQKLALWLCGRDCEVFTQPHQKIGETDQSLSSEKAIHELDLVIVLGGDGTYLNAVRMLNGQQVPVLGINMGSLGFLTNIKIEEMFEALVYTFEGKMEFRERSLFKVDLKPVKGKKQKFLALNDIVIERGALSQLIALSCHYEDFLVCELKADGVVIATPTGSTAYNLAAGGPILHPEVACTVVTPICPHSLTSRPMIFSDRHPLTFQLTNPSQKALLTIDGKMVYELAPDDQVIISKHRRPHIMVRMPTQHYFGVLREKLQFGQRD